jgi:hypothetical protein
MTTFRYAYCTLNELITDLELTGAEDSVLERFILPATQYLLNEIGQFFPTSETRTFAGNGKKILFIDPVLSVSAVTNDETTLAANDYQLEPVQRMWQNGPYVRINCGLDGALIGYWIPEIDAVVISGMWGLYQRVVTTGAILGLAQNSSVTTLTANNGAKISPGMVLQIDDEWQFVKDYGASTLGMTLASALDASSEIVNMQMSEGPVQLGEIIKIDFEQMKVLDIQSSTVYAARGWNKTKKVAHLINAPVNIYRTFNVERAVNGSTAAAHLNSAAISRLVVPDDINYLARQIAALMLKKSQTGYSGRAGNAESGETFYIWEFPKDAIARIKANYYIPAAR